MKRFPWTLSFLFSFILLLNSCSKDEPAPSKPEPEVPGGEQGGGDGGGATFDISSITDTYYDVAGAENVYQWGPYNVHDPSVIKSGDTYYMYSTDVSFGSEIRSGIQIRKSQDLIQWKFVGWAFDGIPAKGKQFIKVKAEILSMLCGLLM